MENEVEAGTIQQFIQMKQTLVLLGAMEKIKATTPHTLDPKP